MTYPFFVHNWRGYPEEGVLRDAVVPDAATICFVAAGDQGSMDHANAAQALFYDTGLCSSDDGQYVLSCISNSTANGVEDFGFFFSDDFGENFTYTAWQDVANNEEILGDSDAFDGGSFTYPANCIWEPFYERFIVMFPNNGNDTTFWWMDPTVDPVTFNQFTVGGASSFGFRTWAVAADLQGGLAIMGRFNGGGNLGRNTITSGPDWNGAGSISDPPGTDPEPNALYVQIGFDGTLVGGEYIWRVSYREPFTDATGINGRLVAGMGNTLRVGARSAADGYFTNLCGKRHPTLAFLIEGGTDRRVWPVVAGMNLDAPTNTFQLPSHPDEDIRLSVMEYNPTAGWCAVGTQASEDSVNEGVKRIYVYTSETGIEGTWNGPFQLTIPLVTYPGQGTSYLDEDRPDHRGLAYLGSGTHWGLMARRQGNQNPVLICFDATAGGAAIIEDGSIEFNANTLAWLALQPKIFMPLNDNGSPATVLDYGSRGYTNNTDTSDLTWGETGPYEGTGMLPATEDDHIRMINSRMGGDYVIIFADVSSRSGDAVLLEFNYLLAPDTQVKVTCTDDGWVLSVRGQYEFGGVPSTVETFDAIPYNGDVAEVIFRVQDRKISTFTLGSTTPSQTKDSPVIGRFGLKRAGGPAEDDPTEILIGGANLIVDNFVVVTADGDISTEEILELMGGSSITLPAPATPTASNVKCLINAEGTPTDLGTGFFDVGNDISGLSSPVSDVWAPSAANVTTAQAKFGSQSIAVPAKDYGGDREPASAFWRGMHDTSINNRDFTIEGHIKPQASGNLCALGSSQQFVRDGIRHWRYGGLTITILGSAGAGTMILSVGADSATARASKSNAISSNAYYVLARFDTFNDADWNHVAVSREDNQFRLFINGQLPTSTTVNGSASAPVLDGGDFTLGAQLEEWALTINNETRYGVGMVADPCFIDGFRFILDEAVFTEPFTVPAAAYS
jgi:hypothetical protein